MAEEVAILMRDTEGWKVPGRLSISSVIGKVTGSSSVTVQKVLRGELLVTIKGFSQRGKEGQNKEGRPPPNFHLKKDPNVVLYCNAQDVTPLVSRDEVQLLEGVTSSASRHVLFVNASRLEWAVSLAEDKEVFINIPGPNLSVPSSGVGVIRYIGPVTGLPGRHFGVEIVDDAYRGHGTTDGTFGSDRYFSCADKNGLFVSLDRISPDCSFLASAQQPAIPRTTATVKPSYASAATGGPAGHTRSQKDPKVVQESAADPPKLRPCLFKMNERVMVYDKHGKEVFGKIRWSGYGTKKRSFGFMAVGIETEEEIFLMDFTENVNMACQSGVPKFRWLVMPETMVNSTERKPAANKMEESLIDLNSSTSIAKKFGRTKEELIADEERVLSNAKEKMSMTEAAKKSHPPSASRQTSFNQPSIKGHVYEPIPGTAAPQDTTRQQSNPADMNKMRADHNKLHHDRNRSQPEQEDKHRQFDQAPLDNYTPQVNNPGAPHSAMRLAPQDDPYGDYVNIPGPAPNSSQTYHGQMNYDPGQHRSQGQPDQYHGQNQYIPHGQDHTSPPSPRPQQYPSPLSQWDQNRQQPQPNARVGSSNPHNLGIGSPVQISSTDPNESPRYGVIRWIGPMSGVDGTISGIELDEFLSGCTDGIFKSTGERFFKCAHGHGLYFPLSNLSPDRRFTPVSTNTPASYVNPIEVPMDEQEDQFIHDATQHMVRYIGNKRGIQGHQNSCYLDSTAFGLFALSDVFDTMFLDPDQSMTSDQNRKRVADLLWKGIVNPLRKNGVVRFESVMKLRTALDELGKMEGITEKEKDPEEFLNMLFKHVLHTKPFISIRRPFGVEQEFFVQLFVEHDPNLRLPTVGDLLHRMFKEQHISFKKVPSKLLLQVPRFGREFQTYKRLIPELKLRIGNLADSNNKSCFICGAKSAVTCKECINKQPTNYCQTCSNLFHRNPSYSERAKHKLCVIQTEAVLGDPDLLSVICIETSHYVCFTRDPRDDGGEKRWIFFDSMADRVRDTYNIPRVTDCTRELNEWVYEGDRERLFNAQPRELPELVRRFTQDMYMCVYVQPDIAMYGDGEDGDGEDEDPQPQTK